MKIIFKEIALGLIVFILSALVFYFIHHSDFYDSSFNSLVIFQLLRTIFLPIYVAVNLFRVIKGKFKDKLSLALFSLSCFALITMVFLQYLIISSDSCIPNEDSGWTIYPPLSAGLNSMTPEQIETKSNEKMKLILFIIGLITLTLTTWVVSFRQTKKH